MHRHDQKHQPRRGNSGENNQGFSVKCLKEDIIHFRPLKKSRYLPKPTTNDTNYDKEKLARSNIKCIRPQSKKKQVNNEGSGRKNR